ncbi:hypothetical protein EsH8_V_000816 [Colletotrichum jinshuiense]
MDPPDTNKSVKPDNVCRILWPVVQPTTKTADEAKKEKKVDDNILQLSVASASLGCESLPKPEPENEGYPSNNGRPILKPASRLGRTNLGGINHQTSAFSPDKIIPSNGFADNSLGILGGTTAPGGFYDPSTLMGGRPLSGGEPPRIRKALRPGMIERPGFNLDTKKSSPGTGHNLNFDPSPKYYLARGMKGNSTISAKPDSPTPLTKQHSEFIVDTPHKPCYKSEERAVAKTPDRPRTVKTAPPNMPAAYTDFMDLDDSPSFRPLRRQMESVRLSSGPGSLNRPVEQPLGPRPLYTPAVPVMPSTPTKQSTKCKRVRGDFEKTTSLSGRDVALEREILAIHAATVQEDDEEDEEDDEDTPKASVLNRHLEVNMED